MDNSINLNLNIDLNKDLNPPIGQASVIGAGAFAYVYESTYGNIPVAIKLFHLEYQSHLDTDQNDYFGRELSRLSQLDHKNIVKLYGACQEAGNKALVMEYVESNLYKMMTSRRDQNQRFSITNIYRIIKAIANALMYMHLHGFVHRDLHPKNILISEHKEVKVADVGISKILQHSTSQDSVQRYGIYAYMAPEIFNGIIHRKSDIFALGIIAFELWSLDNTWRSQSDAILCQKIASGERPHVPDDMPQNLRDLVTSCWQQDYNNRPTASDIVQRCNSELAILASQQCLI